MQRVPMLQSVVQVKRTIYSERHAASIPMLRPVKSPQRVVQLKRTIYSERHYAAANERGDAITNKIQRDYIMISEPTDILDTGDIRMKRTVCGKYEGSSNEHALGACGSGKSVPKPESITQPE
ncbi:hypothetical protein PVAG01_01857 [Phlyctema vagabunda]|uniref:Uncharacterized protein n=1 Tax=Phlyctema vagabunda TaxID=108571 RepID=A0ABR4PYU0_9HELO